MFDSYLTSHEIYVRIIQLKEKKVKKVYAIIKNEIKNKVKVKIKWISESRTIDGLKEF